MKVIQEQVFSVQSMNSGEMCTRIRSDGTSYFSEYYIPKMDRWNVSGVFLSLSECEVRQKAFIAMHNKVMVQ